MAYLLTEIALEMLGCIIYDVDGIPQNMSDFQNHQYAENLEAILKFNKESTTRNKDKKKNMQMSNEDHNKFVKETLSEPLVKLIVKEHSNARQQILYNKKLALSRRIHTSMPEKSAQAMTYDFLEKEIIKLRWESQTIRNFRKVVEQAIMKNKATAYEKYCRTFATGLRLNYMPKKKN